MTVTNFFAMWGLAWWLLLLAELAVGFTLVARKRGAYFLLSVVAYLALLQFLGNTPVLAFLRQHWPAALAGVAGYVVAGVVWFNGRWHWFTSKMRGRYDDFLGRWLEGKGLNELPPPEDEGRAALQVKAEWGEHFAQYGRDEDGRIEYRPRFRDHKDEILSWLTAWPLDTVVMLFTEFLRDLFTMIYYRFQGFLQAIMERNWRGTEGHMLTPQQRAAWEKMREAPPRTEPGGGDRVTTALR